MMLLPKSDVMFFPFSEGAALYRQDTRQLTVLNQNAAVIWCLLNEVDTPDEAASVLQKKFLVGEQKAIEDVTDVVKFFQDNNLLDDGLIDQKIVETPEEIFGSGPSQKIKKSFDISLAHQKVFQVPGITLEICNQDKEIGLMLDEALGHLAVSSGYSVDARLQIVPSDKEVNCWNIFSDSDVVFSEVRKESILPHLLQLIFDISCKALTHYFLFHAAVIVHNSKAVLFPAHVGRGKTTLAAMLARHGFKFFSDELAVIDVETHHVRPFTMPMSIKPGSLAVLTRQYRELDKLNDHFRPDGKVVRYLQPPIESLPKADDTAIVSTLVFPIYKEVCSNILIPLNKEETLQRLAETCSSDRSLGPQDIKAMLALVEQSECMALHYRDTHEAIRLLKEYVFI